MKEKRAARRISEKAEVTISPVSLDCLEVDKKVAHCLTEDISVKGIRIQSEKFLPINSTLKILLSLNEPTRLINILGKIRWIRKLKACEVFEMGIEIVATSKEDSGALKHHIEESPEVIKEKKPSW
ncbi:MAG TPA: PilZ domain-containing protein [Candidatus Desulfaltia sp.]|nr:PilZ domain-containing protein [Candidatus Desulfaltia sp.]